jgi:YfiH family protein
MEPFVLKKQSYFSIPAWEEHFPGLIAGFTTRNGGVGTSDYHSMNLGFHVGDDLSVVCENRRRLAMDIQFPLDSWVGAEQVHDAVILKAGKEDRGKGSVSYNSAIKGTDGFYTDQKGILLTLCYADCVPLFFMAPEHGMIGIAHAGWKGTVKQIAVNMIKQWGLEGIPPEQIFVTIGPSICKKCYIVDKHVIDLVQNILVDVEKKPYNLIKDEQYSLDLQEVNKMLLRKAGVPEKNMMKTDYCSSCHQDQFFSHRRDHGSTGRMLSFIGWKEDSCLL